MMHTSLRHPSSPAPSRALLALLVALGAACAGGHKPSVDPAEPVADTGDRSYIGDAQLAASSENGYEIVQRLRPEYLRPNQVIRNSAPVEADPVLVVDGRLIGPATDLRQMPASSLTRIRYYTVEAAKRRFGMQFTSPVLEATYRQR